MIFRLLFSCIMMLLPFAACLGSNKDYGIVGNEVIAHYTKLGDKEKQRAAEFLVSNMQYHYSYNSDKLINYYNEVINVGKQYTYPKSIPYFQNLYENIGDINIGVNKTLDLNQLSSKQIISNIDSAFIDWQHGYWAKHLSFEQFCEYLLPYRIGNERFEEWRYELRQLFYPYAKVLENCHERQTSAFWAATYVCDGIKKFKFNIDDKALPRANFDLPLSSLISMKMGYCHDYARLTAYIMRACGIPVSVDFTPQWPNKANNHTWNALLDNTLETLPFLGSESYPGKYDRYGEKLAKVYRKTFAYQYNSVYAINDIYKEPLPPSLNDPFMKDVSDEYFKGSSITLKFPETILKRKLVYIAVFNNSEWIPVDYAVVDSSRIATFSSLGREILYMPVYWGRNGAIPCGNPFYICSNGTIKHFESDFDKKITLNIDRKYPLFGRIFDFAKSMVGGYFEAADTSTFVNTERIVDITEIPSSWYNIIQIDSKQKFRYWRYKAPNGSKGNIAEFELYYDGQKLPIIASLCDDVKRNGRKINNFIDNNRLTYYESSHQRGAWVGVDMGKPVQVSEIRIMPRNDDNHIVKGHLYQLCYYDEGKEKPLFTKIAEDDELIFENVPSGGLYILHDLTSGSEERIFSFDNNNFMWY